MTFEARTERQAGAMIVTFPGELDIASEADAAAVLKAALDGAGMLPTALFRSARFRRPGQPPFHN